MRRFCISLVLSIILIVPTVTSAQNARANAALHSAQGGQAMANQQFQQALAEYVLAYAYEANSNRLFDIGRAYEAVGNRATAIEIYRRVVVISKRGVAADRARTQLAVLGAASAPAPPNPGGRGAMVTLTVMPPGAEIWVDGMLKGRSPVPAFKLSSGPHKVQVRLSGYQTYSESLVVNPGAGVARVITLMPGGMPSPAPTVGSAEQLTLTIVGILAGSTVTLNGQPVRYLGTTASARVAPGQYNLRVQHPSFADFSHQFGVGTGQNPTVNVSMTTPKGIGGPGLRSSIAGEWYAVPMTYSGITKIRTTGKMAIKGTAEKMGGTLVLRKELELPRWKRKSCQGAPTATWEIRYGIQVVNAPGGKRIKSGKGNLVSCTCNGMCPADEVLDIPIFVSNTKQVLVGNNLAFLRRQGRDVPKSAFQQRLTRRSIEGKWHLRMGSVSYEQHGKMDLAGSDGEFRGTFIMDTERELQRWRQRQCHGAPTVTATHRYTVLAQPSGAILKVSLTHQATTKCSCKAACATTRKDIQPFDLQLTIDGRHLVGPDKLLSRL